MPMFRRITEAILIALLLASCAAPARREGADASAGATGRPVAGSHTGNGHAPAVVAAPVAGGMLGTKYGSYLDDRDRSRISGAIERALDTNTRQEYTSPDSGARVVVTPQGTSYEHALAMRIMVSPEVNTKYRLRADRRVVFAKTDMDLRAEPKLTSKTTHVFRRGEKAEVVAFVPDSQYRLLSFDGIAMGYGREVYLVARKEDVPPARNAWSANNKRVETTRYRRPARPRQVALEGECKEVKRTIHLPDGRADSEVAKYCRQPPSTWKKMS